MTTFGKTFSEGCHTPGGVELPPPPPRAGLPKVFSAHCWLYSLGAMLYFQAFPCPCDPTNRVLDSSLTANPLDLTTFSPGLVPISLGLYSLHFGLFTRPSGLFSRPSGIFSWPNDQSTWPYDIFTWAISLGLIACLLAFSLGLLAFFSWPNGHST